MVCTFRVTIPIFCIFAVATLSVVTFADTMFAWVGTTRLPSVASKLEFKVITFSVVTFALVIFALVILAFETEIFENTFVSVMLLIDVILPYWSTDI